MLSKSFTASVFLLALASFVSAQCAITPAFGVSGSPGAGDVQQPSDGAPCGSIPISQNIDSSATIQADQSGEFRPSILNFASGAQGSRSITTVKVDPSGTGQSQNFVSAQMINNGEDAPSTDGTQQLVVKLPDGIKCAGGSGQDRCLAMFVTSAGYGNCVVVTQTNNNAKRSAPEDKEKPKPVDLTTPPKKDKKKGGKKMPETRGDRW